MHPDMAEILSDGPPTPLRVFNLSEPTAAEPHDIAAVEYTLSCRACSGERFTLLTHVKIAPDPSSYAEVEPGAAFFQPPHFARCVACGYQARVFDVLTDGYDAVLNQFAGYESGGGDPIVLPGSRAIKVTYLYNVEVTELMEIAAEDKVRPADLFDWIEISAPSDGDEPNFNEGYELA